MVRVKIAEGVGAENAEEVGTKVLLENRRKTEENRGDETQFQNCKLKPNEFRNLSENLLIASFEISKKYTYTPISCLNYVLHQLF